MKEQDFWNSTWSPWMEHYRKSRGEINWSSTIPTCLNGAGGLESHRTDNNEQFEHMLYVFYQFGHRNFRSGSRYSSGVRRVRPSLHNTRRVFRLVAKSQGPMHNANISWIAQQRQKRMIFIRTGYYATPLPEVITLLYSDTTGLETSLCVHSNSHDNSPSTYVRRRPIFSSLLRAGRA